MKEALKDALWALVYVAAFIALALWLGWKTATGIAVALVVVYALVELSAPADEGGEL